MTDIVRVPAENTDLFWPLVEDWIQKALDHSAGEHTIVNVYNALVCGNAVLYVVAEEGEEGFVGVCVAEVLVYPASRVFNLWLIAGKQFKEYLQEHYEFLHNEAKLNGCDFVECNVRKGFIPLLKPMGFKEQYVVMRKKVE